MDQNHYSSSCFTNDDLQKPNESFETILSRAYCPVPVPATEKLGWHCRGGISFLDSGVHGFRAARFQNLSREIFAFGAGGLGPQTRNVALI